MFSPSGRYFAMLMSSPDHYTHIALFDTEVNRSSSFACFYYIVYKQIVWHQIRVSCRKQDEVGFPEFITSGSFVVTSLLKFSADTSVL